MEHLGTRYVVTSLKTCLVAINSLHRQPHPEDVVHLLTQTLTIGYISVIDGIKTKKEAYWQIVLHGLCRFYFMLLLMNGFATSIQSIHINNSKKLRRARAIIGA